MMRMICDDDDLMMMMMTLLQSFKTQVLLEMQNLVRRTAGERLDEFVAFPLNPNFAKDAKSDISGCVLIIR